MDVHCEYFFDDQEQLIEVIETYPDDAQLERIFYYDENLQRIGPMSPPEGYAAETDGDASTPSSPPPDKPGLET